MICNASARTHIEKVENATHRIEQAPLTVVSFCEDVNDLLEITQHLRDEFGKMSRVVGELLEENSAQQNRHMQNLRDIRQSLGGNFPKNPKDQPAKPVTG